MNIASTPQGEPTRSNSAPAVASSGAHTNQGQVRSKLQLAGILVAFSLGAIGRAAATADEPSRVTAKVVRESGVAMWRWLADQLPEKTVLDEKAGELTAPLWASCSTSTEELAKLLVPKYISALPTKDGWGRDLQFCLQLDEAHPTHSALGVRSPGRDGKFADKYEVGRFEPSNADEDTVWVNGYFVRWPEAK